MKKIIVTFLMLISVSMFAASGKECTGFYCDYENIKDLVNAKDYDAAEKKVDESIKNATEAKWNGIYMLHLLRAEIDYKTGDYYSAGDSYEAALETTPDRAKEHIQKCAFSMYKSAADNILRECKNECSPDKLAEAHRLYTRLFKYKGISDQELKDINYGLIRSKP